MNSIRHAAVSLVALGLLVHGAYGAIVTLGTFTEIGNANNDAVVSGASTSGATLTYEVNDNTANDEGIYTTANSPAGVTFSNVGDTLTYTFRYQNITASANSANTVRAGFRFTAECLHWITGIGTNTDGRFNYQSSNNYFGSGTTVGASAVFANNAALLFDTGNTLDVTFELKLVATGASNSYDFKVTYVNGSNSNTRTHTFTGVTGTTVTGFYHLTNSAIVEVPGDTWTVANASATMVPEPSAIALLAGLGALGLVLRRRRLGRG